MRLTPGCSTLFIYLLLEQTGWELISGISEFGQSLQKGWHVKNYKELAKKTKVETNKTKQKTNYRLSEIRMVHGRERNM